MTQATAQFFHNGKAIAFPAAVVPKFMERALAEHGLDRREMAGIASRLIRDEDARELFQELTGLEVVVNGGAA